MFRFSNYTKMEEKQSRGHSSKAQHFQNIFALSICHYTFNG